jgi:hypothetical protein
LLIEPVGQQACRLPFPGDGSSNAFLPAVGDVGCKLVAVEELRMWPVRDPFAWQREALAGCQWHSRGLSEACIGLTPTSLVFWCFLVVAGFPGTWSDASSVTGVR